MRVNKIQSNTGKSDAILQHMCYAIVYVAELSLALKSLLQNGCFPKTAQHGQYLHSLFAIHELLKIQFLHVFIQAKLRRLHESVRDYL